MDLSYNGSVLATALYGPYGVGRYATGTMPSSKGYTGQRQDSGSGLDYYNARYYDGAIGQFTSADSVQGPNRYGYVGGNPETENDPTGKCPFCIVLVVFAVGTLVDAGSQYMDTGHVDVWHALTVGGGLGLLTLGAAVDAPAVLAATALGALEGVGQGVVSGDSPWKLVDDGLVGGAAGGITNTILQIDPFMPPSLRGVFSNGVANLFSQTYSHPGHLDRLSFILSLGWGLGGAIALAREGLAGAAVLTGADLVIQTVGHDDINSARSWRHGRGAGMAYGDSLGNGGVVQTNQASAGTSGPFYGYHLDRYDRLSYLDE